MISDHLAAEIAVGGRLVWREQGGIWSATKDGADVVTLDAAADPLYFAIAADDTYAYWATGSPVVARAPADGSGAAEELVTGRFAERLRRTATYLFLAENPGDQIGVSRLDLATREVLNLAVEPSINPNLTVAGDSVYFSFQGSSVGSRDTLMSAPIEPGPSALLIDEQPIITAIAVTATDIYYGTGGDNGAICRLPR